MGGLNNPRTNYIVVCQYFLAYSITIQTCPNKSNTQQNVQIFLYEITTVKLFSKKQTVGILVALLLNSVFYSLLVSTLMFSETGSVKGQVFLGR